MSDNDHIELMERLGEELSWCGQGVQALRTLDRPCAPRSACATPRLKRESSTPFLMVKSMTPKPSGSPPAGGHTWSTPRSLSSW